MVIAKGNKVGRFSVEVELANYDDLARARAGDIPQAQVRRLSAQGVVDSGATRLVLPESIAEQLGLRRSGPVNVRYADGRTAAREMAHAIQLTYFGRSSVFNAVIEPGRDSILIGAIVLEDLDLVVDCANQTLTPRDPDRIVSEIE
jgi:predicted aspartyl protease